VIRQGLLPVGDLEIVGELIRDNAVIVDRRRAFAVRGSAAPVAGATPSAAALGAIVGDISGLVPRFTRDDVLASPLLARALDALSSRAHSDAARQAIARARAGQHTAPDASLATSLANGDPATAAFLSGLADLAALPGPAVDPTARALARADLERAAQRFREALRADADFLPAAVFLGACYALGGRDRDAAGAWQTALIGIDDDPRLFALIVDARLRAGDAAGAEDVAAEAEKRWPADAALRQRRAVLELARGRVAEALTALDALEQPSTDLLFAALRILHGARAAGLAVEDPSRDRARFERYATRYRELGGPDQALVSGWAGTWK
jgi:tetratricopeptide (TPR) repeat protein